MFIHDDVQAQTEDLFNPKHITNKVVQWIVQQPQIVNALQYGVQLYTAWLDAEHSPDKKQRLNMLRNSDLQINELLMRIITHALIKAHDKDLLINVVMPLMGKLRFSDRFDSIQTAFELVALLSRTGLYQIFKLSVRGSLMIKASVQLPKELLDEALNKEYMPPVLGRPRTIKNNNMSAYQTLNYSVFNGSSINRHDGEVCLDALNIINKVRFKLDHDFINNITEQPNTEIKEKNAKYLSKTEIADLIQMKTENFQKYLHQSVFMVNFIEGMGGEFSFNHKIDKRGRIYSEGFIFNPQGNAYRKGQLCFAKSVGIDIPDKYRKAVQL